MAEHDSILAFVTHHDYLLYILTRLPALLSRKISKKFTPLLINLASIGLYTCGVVWSLHAAPRAFRASHPSSTPLPLAVALPFFTGPTKSPFHFQNRAQKMLISTF